MAMWGSLMVDCLRINTIIWGLSNLAVVIVGGVLLFPVFPGCDVDRITIPVVMVSLAAAFKMFAMFNSGIAQRATAITILDSSPDTSVVDSINRLRRRVIICSLLSFFSKRGTTSNGNKWKTKLLIPLVITVCFVPLMHCFVGPAVLRWRSFYETQDDAWKAHYQEVFDHGIREALCCLGHAKYISHIQPNVKRRVESSFPHHGHSGIIEVARDLYMQIEGDLADNARSFNFVEVRMSETFAWIRALVLVTIQVMAEACSEFVTSIVHNNEFSTRLSVGALQQLRAAAIVALAQDSKADKALNFRLARQFLFVSMNQSRISCSISATFCSHYSRTKSQRLCGAGSKKVDHSYSLWNALDRTNNGSDTDDDNFENPFNDKVAVMNSLDDPVSQLLETVPRSENGSAGNEAEMFLPGLVIHMVPQRRYISMPFWKGWRVQESVRNYYAYSANREIFKDIVVSPNMFFGHLPWRCHNAMRKLLESQNDKGLLDISRIV
ncbi:hypothetical protein SADUNF_Sadunf02G0184100 [Salix dunnii]|uniref:DUF7358 domain-containing protein n=1 Tax=Salix dunnii TaxID=1413687 RepID=A0A835N8Z9_9ROSI|nr:hypothetical protein SADUNF_Sadunf02G0184100 [Salix dunnii]